MTLKVSLDKTILSLLAILYCYGQYIAYWPVYYEDQFIHGQFIQDLINNEFHWKNFFTVFGEHLFPGYSILVYLNYKLFGISLAFEYVTTIVVNVMAAFYINSLLRRCGVNNNWALCFASLVLLSPVQYPMKSMALIASISVLFLIFIFDLLILRNRYSVFLCAVPIYILFLGGAYTAGFVVCAIFYLLFYNSNRKFALFLGSVNVISFSIYYYILVAQGSVGSVHDHLLNIPESLRFASIMLGSSLIGKAYYEATHNYSLYYASSAALLIITAHVIFIASRYTLEKGRQVILVCLIYSYSIIIIASYARYQNGPELAMGQWYQHHIKYIPVFLVAFLFINPTEKFLRFYKAITLSVMIASATGYLFEFKKLPYAREWRRDISNHAIKLLIDNNISYGDMNVGKFYWPDGWARRWLNLFYENRLAYFKTALASGFQRDGWVLTGDKLQILCPFNSRELKMVIDAGRYQAMNPNHDCMSTMMNGRELLTCRLPAGYAHIELNSSYSFLINSNDLRPLSYHVKEFLCK